MKLDGLVLVMAGPTEPPSVSGRLAAVLAFLQPLAGQATRSCGGSPGPERDSGWPVVALVNVLPLPPGFRKALKERNCFSIVRECHQNIWKTI